MKVEKADVFIALNQVGYDKYIDTKDDAIVLINSTSLSPIILTTIVFRQRKERRRWGSLS